MKPQIKLKHILKLTFGTGSLFYVTLSALIITAIMTLLIPISLRVMIDQGISENTNIAFGGAALLAVALAVGTSVRYYTVSLVGERIFTTLRQKVFEAVMAFSADERDKFLTGDLMSRLVADAEVIRSFTGSSLSVAGRNILLLLGGLTMMIISNLTLSLIALAIIPIVIIPLLLIGRRLKEKSKIAQIKLSEANSRAEEIFHALETVQNFTREAIENNIFFEKSRHVYESSKHRVASRAFLTFMVITLVFLGVVAILWYGAQLVHHNIISPGMLAQFLLYTVFTAGAASVLSEVWGDLQKASSSYDRMVELLNIFPDIQAGQGRSPSVPLRGQIDIQNVSLKYKTREKNALDLISLTINSGQKVAFIGSSGSGKTSLFKLLLCQYYPNQGRILLDGQDMTELDPAYIRHNIAYVSQDVTLFTGTVFENIAFGNDHVSETELIQAAKNAYLHDFIMSLPDGYHSHIGEKGLQLSGGQKQRLTIARAIIKNAAIILLDEATGALDTESEMLVAKALDELSQSKTVLTIAHRLSTVKNYEKIYIIESGKIIASGTYNALRDAGYIIE
ncbi:MAG: ABC transporter transmembrane domain-containing protein [Pseudomonadota bacterium]